MVDWWNGFLRWPELNERKPHHLTLKRAEATSKDVIDEWFEKVEKLYMENGLLKRSGPVGDLADRLWNCDETALATCVM